VPLNRIDEKAVPPPPPLPSSVLAGGFLSSKNCLNWE
jgi:hypothetical protein